MGLRERIKRRLTSPVKVVMTGLGSDPLVRAGATARVVVEVRGTDDGTIERVAVYLRMIGWGNERVVRWPLGEVPAALGVHELEVAVPAELAPSCVEYAQYAFAADLKRSSGPGSTAVSVVDVIPRPEDLYWPAARSEGLIEIELDADVVDVGGTVTGRVLAGEAVEVSFGPFVDTLVTAGGMAKPQPRKRFTEVASTSGPAFRFDVPAGFPPTLFNGGETWVVWQVRVTSGDQTSWRVVGVRDPEVTAGVRNGADPDLRRFLRAIDA